MKAHGPKFDDKILVKVPASVAAALDQVAGRRLQTRSEFIRQSLLKALEAEGLHPLAA
jgi:metal-responsive CopG/Arc/MetJ family transcriptional regulator